MKKVINTYKFDPLNVPKYWKNQQPEVVNGKQYIDPYFPPSASSILAQDSTGKFIDEESGPEMAKEFQLHDIEWKSAKEIFKNDYLIFDNTIEFADINQGNLGNCYFLSALAALAEQPFLIFQLFKTKEVNNEGVYEIVLFIDGKWQLVFVDDYFPVLKGTNQMIFSRPNGNEIWVCLLEKAWAKVNGGYANTVSGWPSDPLQTLTGFPTKKFTHKEYDEDKLWKFVKDCDSQDEILCTSSKGDEEASKFGLVGNHAYTLISAIEKEYNGVTIRLLKIRNPWGYKEWNGDWSDTSLLWTEELKKLFGHEDKNDGIFFINIADFKKFFLITYAVYIIYDANVKRITIEKEELVHPQVYNLFIEEDSKTALSLQFKHWRFNRELKNTSHPYSIVLARYDNDREISNVSGAYNANLNIEIIKELPRGMYVIWVYGKIDKYNENSYLNIYSSSNYTIQKVGEDADFSFIKHLLLQGVKEKFKKEVEEREIFYKIENVFGNTGIGYRAIINKSKTKYQIWKNDASKMQNMFLLPPFENKTNFDVSVPPNGEAIFLGMRNTQFGSYCFDIKSTFSTYSCKENEQPVAIHAVDLPRFLTFTKEQRDPENYYNYISISLATAHEELKFKTTSDVDSVLERYRIEYPFLIQELTKLQPYPEDKELKWGHYQYSNGLYLGQFNVNRVRHGRGAYVFSKEKTSYIGYWVEGEKQGFARFFDGKNKLTFEGNFEKGIKSGQGKCYYSNGDIYEGNYENNLRSGKGTFFWKDGSRWEGSFLKGNMHGSGMYHCSNGEVWKVDYDNGKAI